jgi:microcystin-dependent protein
MDEAFIGTIMMFAGNFAPKNWALCNGQLLPIAQNTALFSILGTTYGGNGTTTFALPNLQSRIPMQAGQGEGLSHRELGEMGGLEAVTLTVDNLPAHNHLINCKGAAGNSNTPKNNFPAGDNDTTATPFAAGRTDATMDPGALSQTGGSRPVAIESPYLVVNFIICHNGIYPARP